MVIEYSDLPDDVARRRNPDGSLAIWAGSIAVHVFDLPFWSGRPVGPTRLPLHVARKKVAWVDPSGRRSRAAEPNALKFERFIFDLMPSARNAIVVEVDPARAFAPLKNAPGAPHDSPEWVKSRMVAIHRDWLRCAGVEVPDDVAVEISPLLALDAEELKGKFAPGTRVTEAAYLR